jgi:hypothetical protein
MANPTTNYGFVLPTPTDLVTDLPADFEVALQGVDTRLKALQPGTTEGDIAYSSATANTNTRLGIGSTGNVLTVAGGVPTWAAPAASASGLTLVKAQTIGTSVTSVTVTDAFSATYDDYLITITGGASTSNTSDLAIKFGATTSGYKFAGFYMATTSATITGYATNSSGTLPAGGNSTNGAASEIFVTSPFLAARTGIITKSAPTHSDEYLTYYAGNADNTTSYTSFIISQANNMTGGVIRVYGYQKS